MKIKQLGLLFGLMGVFTSGFSKEAKSCKKDADLQAQDCKSLCFAGPQLEDDYELDIMAAAIYEQVRVQGMEIGSTTTSKIHFDIAQGAAGVEPTETTSWGFKVGAGWKTGHDDWKLAARYTWFKAITESAPILGYSGNGFFPTAQSFATLNDTLTGGCSFMNVESGNYTMLNTVNVYLMRPTLYTALLEVSPYFGVDISLTRRRQTTLFTNENTISQHFINGGYYRVYDNNSWWGVGPMFGVATNWYVGYGVGIYADAYAALTYGQASSYSQNFSYEYMSTGIYSAVNATVYNQLYQFSPEMNTQLGLEWNHLLEDDRGLIGFKIGYEAAYYFQVNKRILNSAFYNVGNGAGIGIQGLVLEGHIDF